MCKIEEQNIRHKVDYINIALANVMNLWQNRNYIYVGYSLIWQFSFPNDIHACTGHFCTSQNVNIIMYL